MIRIYDLHDKTLGDEIGNETLIRTHLSKERAEETRDYIIEYRNEGKYTFEDTPDNYEIVERTATSLSNQEVVMIDRKYGGRDRTYYRTVRHFYGDLDGGKEVFGYVRINNLDYIARFSSPAGGFNFEKTLTDGLWVVQRESLGNNHEEELLFDDLGITDEDVQAVADAVEKVNQEWDEIKAKEIPDGDVEWGTKTAAKVISSNHLADQVANFVQAFEEDFDLEDDERLTSYVVNNFRIMVAALDCYREDQVVEVRRKDLHREIQMRRDAQNEMKDRGFAIAKATKDLEDKDERIEELRVAWKSNADETIRLRAENANLRSEIKNVRIEKGRLTTQVEELADALNDAKIQVKEGLIALGEGAKIEKVIVVENGDERIEIGPLVDCPDCDGSGQVPAFVVDVQEIPTQFAECPFCLGRGLVTPRDRENYLEQSDLAPPEDGIEF